MKAQELAEKTPIDIIGTLGTIEKITEVSLPILKKVFDGISTLFENMHFDKLSTAPGKKKAILELQGQIAVLQAQNATQKLQNSVMVAALKQLGVDVDSIVV